MAKQKAASGYEEGKNALSALLTKPITTPLQVVTPVTQAPAVEPEPVIAQSGKKLVKIKPEKKENPYEGLEHVNFWTEREVFDRLKVHAALSRRTIREIATEALDQYLKKQGR